MSDASTPPPPYSDWGADQEAIEFLETELNTEAVAMLAANHAVHDDQVYQTVRTVWAGLTDDSRSRLNKMNYFNVDTQTALIADTSEHDYYSKQVASEEHPSPPHTGDNGTRPLTPNPTANPDDNISREGPAEINVESPPLTDGELVHCSDAAINLLSQKPPPPREENNGEGSELRKEAEQLADHGSWSPEDGTDELPLLEQLVFPMSKILRDHIDPGWEPVQLGLMVMEGELKDDTGTYLLVSDDVYLIEPFHKIYLVNFLAYSDCRMIGAIKRHGKDGGANEYYSVPEKIERMRTCSFGPGPDTVRQPGSEYRIGFLLELANKNRRLIEAMVFIALVETIVSDLSDSSLRGRFVLLDPRTTRDGMLTFPTFDTAVSYAIAEYGDIVDVVQVRLPDKRPSNARGLDETYHFRDTSDGEGRTLNTLKFEYPLTEKTSGSGSLFKTVFSSKHVLMVNGKTQEVRFLALFLYKVEGCRVTESTETCRVVNGFGFVFCGFTGICRIYVGQDRRQALLSVHLHPRNASDREQPVLQEGVRVFVARKNHLPVRRAYKNFHWAMAYLPLGGK